MASKIAKVFLLAGYLALRASAACTVFGVDYSNGGSYNIDTTSDESFVFTSIFQGCRQESVNPALVDPDGHQYTCTSINTTPDGAEVKSTCSIAYSSMSSGQWKIIISGASVAVQRVINLTSAAPSTVVVTATPTVVIGITSTPNPTTVFTTIGTQTQTLILNPGTITTPCSGATTTVTVTPPKATSTVVSVVVRTTTDATTTKSYQTTTTKTAVCHYTTKRPTPTICIGLTCSFPDPPCIPGIFCPLHSTDTPKVADSPTASAKEILTVFVATTVTVTETTFTVTSTAVTVLPTPTTTENVFFTTTATVTPAPSTVCSGQKPGATVSVTRPQATVTQTSLSYSTKHVTGTVSAIVTRTAVTTNSRSASSCWANGGWMGAD
ncbi:hypothetical protein F4808DRAFT_4871 [Astrocystis sublimbata]|nr:hypothetical protein F4808DRAFT_4871 [Astrocystis sublimbata]